MSEFSERIANLSPKRLALLALELQSKIESMEKWRQEPIAVIGIGCRFPGGADGPDGFWRLLSDGVDAITEVPPDRWDLARYYDPDPDAPGKMNTRHGGFLAGVDRFDPHFFNISRREALSMDPQQRLLLEVSWEALEHAAQSPEKLEGSRTGVFVGICNADYRQRLLARSRDTYDTYMATGSSHAIASGRLSYFLGVHGPSVSIDTACSSSLVAVHLACQSLRAKECRTALAGGVNLILSPDTFIMLSKARMMAADGRCKAFDAAADGFVRGEGCGIVALKRLADALSDGDRILALLSGSAVNQDGRSSGITAPNGPAQESVIREALSAAGVSPADVGYVETHGTGTALGDPIEVNALGTVYGAGRRADAPLRIGSVKTNIGHLESAAGVAGLIKLILAVQHGEVPPHLHLKKPNPYIPWNELPIEIPAELRPWSSQNGRRIGAVSSFGFSGTNAHIVVQEAPEAPVAAAVSERPYHLLTLSAKSNDALRQQAVQYRQYLVEHPSESLANICFSANTGRAQFSHRLGCVASSNAQLQEDLGAFAAENSANVVSAEVAGNNQPEVVFLFSGQGSQYVGMGRQLYQTQPAFRRAIDRCDEILRSALDCPLASVLYSDPPEISQLDQTAFTQPALFAFEYALAELWQSWGVHPAAVMGHSIGEYVAACFAGVFNVEDALKLVAERGRLMQALPEHGEMAAVLADEAQVTEAIAGYPHELSIAAINGPDNIVISGASRAVQAVTAALNAKGIEIFCLRVSHAFHSPLMEPMLDALSKAASTVRFTAPTIPLCSNVSGQLTRDASIANPSYWRRHAREAIRFSDGMQALSREGYKLFIEIGPSPTLCGMASKCLPGDSSIFLPSLRRGRADWQQMLQTLASLYVRGVDMDLAAMDRDFPRRKVALPSYPFQRERYWIDVEDAQDSEARESGGRAQLGDYLYEVRWQAKKSPAYGQSHPVDYVPELRQIAEAMRPQVAHLYSNYQLHRYDEMLPRLDRVCASYVLEAFKKLGWKPQRNERVVTEELLERLGVQVRHRRLLERLLGVLAEDGILRPTDGDWVVAGMPSSDADRDMSNLRAQFPECAPELDMVRRCGERFADALLGTIDPLQLLFPDGSTEGAEKLYRDAPAYKAFNSLVQLAVAATLERLPAGRTLRVLEIGGGTGGTTSSVLSAFPTDRTEYVFTDAGQLFTAKAARKFSSYDFVQYAVLDISNDPEPQGFPAHSFDIVIAANVLHATLSLRQSLANVRKLLASDGLLVLLEGTVPVRLGDLTVGLTEGWWSFSDTDLRPSYALLSEQKWRDLLAAEGFTDIAAIPEGADRRGVLSTQAVILSRGPALQLSERSLVPAESKQWVIFADKAGAGDNLMERLRGCGEKVATVKAGDRYESSTHGRFTVRAECPDDFERLFRDLLRRDGSSPMGIVYLWALDAPSAEETNVEMLLVAQKQVLGSALYLVQALVPVCEAADIRLWLGTRGAQALEQQPGTVSLQQAPLWGLAKVIALEHPELRCKRIDLDGSELESDAGFLFGELCSDDAEDQVAIRAKSRYVARLVRSTLRQDSESPAISANATYFVTGGLGGLGLAVAEWLINRGARHLVLLGRNGPSEAVRNRFREWERAGVRIVIEQSDVSDRSRMAEIFERIDRSLPPLRGIVHSAGVLDDGILLRQDWQRFLTVMNAKVIGSWILHTLTEKRSLDFFVMFSSAASLLGSAGQANHAAANAFVDGLAHYRKSKGLPALSINWGPWAEVGAAARHDQSDRITKGGRLVIAPKDGLEIFGRLLGAAMTQIGVLPIVFWSEVVKKTAERDCPPFFDRLMRELSQPKSSEVPQHREPQLLHELQNNPPSKQRYVLQNHVQEDIAKILGLKHSASIVAHQPLSELGLDSLMAMELANRLSKATGHSLSATLVFKHPTIEAIVDYLSRDVLSLDLAARADRAPAYDGDSSKTGNNSKLEDLSEHELAALLEKKLNVL